MSDANKRSPIARRLEAALAARGVSGTWLEKTGAIGRGYSSYILTGARRYLRPDTIQKIADTLRVSSTWLEQGEGPMFLPGQKDDWPPPGLDVKRSRGKKAGATSGVSVGTPTSLEDDPYVNRRAFRQTREFQEAPREVQEWLIAIDRDEGDLPTRQWLEVLDLGLRLQTLGALHARPSAAANAPADDARESAPHGV